MEGGLLERALFLTFLEIRKKQGMKKGRKESTTYTFTPMKTTTWVVTLLWKAEEISESVSLVEEEMHRLNGENSENRRRGGWFWIVEDSQAVQIGSPGFLRLI